MTESEYLGLVPSPAQVGDSIVVFLGAQVPHSLRSKLEMKTDQENQPAFDVEPAYSLVGEAYIHGLTNGEAI